MLFCRFRSKKKKKNDQPRQLGPFHRFCHIYTGKYFPSPFPHANTLLIALLFSSVITRYNFFDSGSDIYQFNIMKLHLLSTILFSSSWVKLDGVTYKEDAVILLKPGTDLEHPTFGQIKAIHCQQPHIYIHAQVKSTEEYSEHYCVYVLSSSYLTPSPYTLNALPNTLYVSHPNYI